VREGMCNDGHAVADVLLRPVVDIIQPATIVLVTAGVRRLQRATTSGSSSSDLPPTAST